MKRAIAGLAVIAAIAGTTSAAANPGPNPGGNGYATHHKHHKHHKTHKVTPPCHGRMNGVIC